MKIAAIVQRAKQRDFLDIYYLLKKISFGKIIEATYAKYPWYEENSKIIFKSLTYFDDANQDNEVSAVKIFDKSVTWPRVKKEISKKVAEYLKKVL